MGPWGIILGRGVPSLALCLGVNRLQGLPTHSGRMGRLVHGLYLTMACSFSEEQEEKFLSSLGTFLIYSSLIPSHLPSSCNNEKRCLHVLGDPRETQQQRKGFVSYLTHQSFLTSLLPGRGPTLFLQIPGAVQSGAAGLERKEQLRYGVPQPPPHVGCRRQKPPIPAEVHMTHRLALESPCTASASVCNHPTNISVTLRHSCTHM